MSDNELKQLAELKQTVDKVYVLLHGQPPDQEGLAGKVNDLHEEIFGGRAMGLKTRVMVMWRIHVWLLCTASAALGFVVRGLIQGVVIPK